jgi:hypothetical protein
MVVIAPLRKNRLGPLQRPFELAVWNQITNRLNLLTCERSGYIIPRSRLRVGQLGQWEFLAVEASVD